VDHILAQGDYVELHTRGAAYLVRDTISALEQRIDPARFMRCHRSIIVGGALVAAAPVMAQASQTPDNAEPTTVGEIVVTGSRIARPNQDSPVPVSVTTAQHIEATGQMNTGDILRTLPEAGVSTFTPTTTTISTADNGVPTVDMRSLGENRTLVLVNDRRHVASIVGSQIVDFNTIPTDFIDRIDVVTGAASAVYGSDALAGVINIITQRDFEGLELSAKGGITERGDNENFKIGLKVGSNFADDRGNFVGALGWRRTGSVYGRDRCDREMCIDAAATTARQHNVGVFSSFIPRGTVLVPRVSAGNLTRVVDDSGAVVPYTNAGFGYNRSGERQLFVPEEQIRFNGQLTYDINDNHRFFSEMSIFHGRNSSEIEGNPVGSEAIYQDRFGIDQLPDCRDFDGDNECRYGVPITNAIVPTALANAVRAQHPGIADDDLVVGFRRRINDVGNRGNESERAMARLVLGFEGKLTPNLNYELSMNYGRSDYDQRPNGDIMTSRFRQPGRLSGAVHRQRRRQRQCPQRSAGRRHRLRRRRRIPRGIGPLAPRAADPAGPGHRQHHARDPRRVRCRRSLRRTAHPAAGRPAVREIPGPEPSRSRVRLQHRRFDHGLGCFGRVSADRVAEAALAVRGRRARPEHQ
jgi:iron complex outermembrane receptor protein